MEVSIKGKTSLNCLVGIGSKIQVDGLEETIDDTSVMIVGRIPSIFSLTETILLVKKLMKSSLLRVKGIHGSTELGCLVSAEKKPKVAVLLFYQ